MTLSIWATLTVSDADSPTLASATVIDHRRACGRGDVLAATTDGYQHHGELQRGDRDADADGTDTLAHYQPVLDSVTFSSSSQNPTNFGADTSRTVSWVVNDGPLKQHPGDHARSTSRRSTMRRC